MCTFPRIRSIFVCTSKTPRAPSTPLIHFYFFFTEDDCESDPARQSIVAPVDFHLHLSGVRRRVTNGEKKIRVTCANGKCECFVRTFRIFFAGLVPAVRRQGDNGEQFGVADAGAGTDSRIRQNAAHAAGGHVAHGRSAAASDRRHRLGGEGEGS